MFFPFRRAKKGEGGSRGGKSEKTLKEEAEADRAKAAAALWEARLEVTEVSRKEYREAARRLARNNEELDWHQRKLEKDTLEVITFLKKQDLEKDELVSTEDPASPSFAGLPSFDLVNSE